MFLLEIFVGAFLAYVASIAIGAPLYAFFAGIKEKNASLIFFGIVLALGVLSHIDFGSGRSSSTSSVPDGVAVGFWLTLLGIGFYALGEKENSDKQFGHSGSQVLGREIQKSSNKPQSIKKLLIPFLFMALFVWASLD